MLPVKEIGGVKSVFVDLRGPPHKDIYPGHSILKNGHGKFGISVG
jgi:hypothetical protein